MEERYVNSWLNPVNPIVKCDESELVKWGQKTLPRRPTAMDRVCCRRMMLYIEKRIRSYLLKLLDSELSVCKSMELAAEYAKCVLRDIQMNRGIAAHEVEYNNSMVKPAIVVRIKLTGVTEWVVWNVVWEGDTGSGPWEKVDPCGSI